MKRKFAKFCALAILLSGLFFTGNVFAQSSRSADQSSTPSAEDVQSNSGPEDNSKDETAQFKHSSSVQMLARITGLSQDGAYWLAVVINFGVIAGLIFWASKKNLPAMFRNRTAAIQKQIAEARQASEDANRRLSEIESRLGRLDQEIAQMKATAEREAAAEEERIKAAAQEDAARIVESAEQEIAAAAKAARRDLTTYAADLAVTLAAKQIRVDAPTDQALLRRFVRQLSNGGAPEKKN
jgi:F-type H+-transporting ATPase subunit b